MFWFNITVGVVGSISAIASLCISIARIKRKKLICRYKLHPRFAYNPDIALKNGFPAHKSLIVDEKILEVEIVNVGNIDITSSSFEGDIILEILGGVIADTRPASFDINDIDFDMSFEKFKVFIKPTLIKKREKIHFESLIINTDNDLEVEIESRIIDLKPIKIIRGSSEIYEQSLLGFAKVNKAILSKEEVVQYLAERSSFWIATISILTFLVGNMMGQHGWYAFWESVLGQ